MPSLSRRVKTAAATALQLPAFGLAVFFMYWSVPLCMLQRQIQTWKFIGSRNDAYGWGLGLQRLFGIKLRQVPGRSLYKGGPCIWLCNHRSWADFFVDVLTTQGDSQMLSRMAVAAVFPMFMISVVIIRSVILFKRGAIRNKEKFNAMIDRKMAQSPVNGLNVYPEGHRSTLAESLPLRRGMLHYAYSRQLPVQIVITANKEAVISEKDWSAHFGQTLLVGYSPVLQSKDYTTADAFFEAIQTAWLAEWKRVYSFDWSQSQAFEDGGVDYQVEYTRSIRLLSVLSQGLSMVCFLATLYYSFCVLMWGLRLCGSWAPTAAVLLTLWVSASLLNACRTVQPPSPQRQDSTSERKPALPLANGRANSSGLGVNGVVRRSSANNLAATDIGSQT